MGSMLHLNVPEIMHVIPMVTTAGKFEKHVLISSKLVIYEIRWVGLAQVLEQLSCNRKVASPIPHSS